MYDLAPLDEGGFIVYGATHRGLCYAGFGKTKAVAVQDMRARWPAADYAKVDLEGMFSDNTVNLDLYGTPFQLAVWQALLDIPEGQKTTYADLARQIGKPDAVRAVGNAIGKNPVAVLVPCHRVVRTDGSLGGYAWGVEVKSRLLAAEAA